MADPFADLDPIPAQGQDPFADLDAPAADPFADLDAVGEQQRRYGGSAVGALERGVQSGMQRLNTDIAQALGDVPVVGGMIRQGLLEDAAANERRLREIPRNENQGMLGRAVDVVLESVPQAAAPIAAAIATRGASLLPQAAAMGLASGATERSGAVDDYLKQQGVNFADPAAIDAAYRNPDLMSQARAYGAKRGAVVGAADALTLGASSKVGGALLRAGRPVGAAVTALGIEAGGGAAGEAGAQIATDGRVTDWRAVGDEALGEVIPGGVEVGAALAGRRATGPGANIVQMPEMTPEYMAQQWAMSNTPAPGPTGEANATLTADPYAPQAEDQSQIGDRSSEIGNAPQVESADPFVDLDAGLSQGAEPVPGFNPQDLLGLQPAVPEQAAPPTAGPVRSLADVFADLDAAPGGIVPAQRESLIEPEVLGRTPLEVLANKGYPGAKEAIDNIMSFPNADDRYVLFQELKKLSGPEYDRVRKIWVEGGYREVKDEARRIKGFADAFDSGISTSGSLPPNVSSSPANVGSSSPNLAPAATPSAPAPAPAAIPQATPAQKAAVKKEVKTPEPVKQASAFDAKAAQGQKKFLVAEIDKAIAAATVDGLPGGKTAAARQEEARKLQQKAQKMLKREDLAEEERRRRADDLEKEAQDELAKAAEADASGYVTIDVPGDGQFTIANTKESLRAFKERVAKKYPTTLMKPEAVNPPSMSPGSVGALGKPGLESAVKAAELFASQDPDRAVLGKPVTDGRFVIAVDGKRLIYIETQGIPGGATPNELKAIGRDGKLSAVEGGKFHVYRQIVPTKSKQLASGVNAERFGAVLRQLLPVVKDNRTDVADVILAINPDGTLGASVGREDQSGEHNLQPGHIKIAGANGDYLLDIVAAMRANGQEAFDFGITVDQNGGSESNYPLVFRAGPVSAVLMPIRGRMDGVALDLKAFPDMMMPAPDAPVAGQPEQSAKPKRGKKNTKDNPFPAGMPRPGWAAAPYDGGADKVESQAQAMGGMTPAGRDTVRQPFSTPELLKLLRELGMDVPRIMRDLGARGRFIGAAPAAPGPDGKIELDASTARVLQPKELMALEAQAGDEAQLEHDAMQAAAALGGAPVPADFLQTRTDELFRELAAARLEWAKVNRGQEELAKTLTHELGHLVSYAPDRTFARGNILGRFFHAAKYTRKMLAEHPSMMGNMLKPADRARLARQADQAAGAKPTDPAALATWQQARKNAYTNLLDAEARRRGLVQVKDVVRETDPLIAWWQGEERIPGYYRQPEERWAELMAIYALAPGQFQTRAPLTYQLLDNWLTANPELKAPFDAIQRKIDTGEHITEFERDLEESMDAADKAAVMILQSKEPTWGEFRDSARVMFDRRRGAMLRRLDSLRKSMPDVYERAKGALKTWQYKDNANKEIVDWGKKFQADHLAPRDISWRRFGTYLFLRRVLNERYDLANPLGTDSKRATIILEKWRQTMGPEKFAAMEAAAGVFDQRHQQVLDYIEKTGTENPELMAKLRTNDAYATFSVIPEEIPDGGSLAEMIATADPRRPGAGVKRQTGTLKRVENPATATMKKWMQWMNQADKQVAIRENVKVLRDHFGEARPANLRFIDGRPQPDVKDGSRVGTLMWRENGRVQAAYVPRSIADAFNNSTSTPVTALARQVAGTYQALHTAWNPAFWPVGFAKDIMGTVARTPGMRWLGDRGLIRRLQPALKSAWNLHFGVADATGQQALNRRMLQGLRDSGLFNENDAGIDRLMREFGQAPLGMTRRPGVKGFLDSWNRMGQVFEHAVKIAGMTWVDANMPNLTEEARREMVRVNIGSPEFSDSGTAAPWMNLFSPFLNAAKQGWRAQIEARHAFDNKWEYAGKLLAYGIGPRLALIGLAQLMWPDDDEREAAKASIPNRDKRLYLTIPLGWYDKNARKVAYLRIPQDETSALIGGIFETMYNQKGSPIKAETLEFVGSRFKPGDNTLLGLPFQWLTFMVSGEAPVDAFTGRKVMSETQEAAGGADAVKAMAKHTYNQLPEIVRFPLGALTPAPGRFDITSRPESKRGMLEELSRLPGASRIFRVSNAGMYDQVAPARAQVKQANAQRLLTLQNIAVRYAEGERVTGEELRGILANDDNKRYIREQIRKHRLREEDPVAGMIDAASTKAEREAVRRALAETAPPD